MACKYIIKDAADKDVIFDTKEALVKHIHDNELYKSLPHAKREFQRSTEDLADVLRQVKFGENKFDPQVLKQFQTSLLDDFIKLEDQSAFFFKMGGAIALTKGLGKSFDQIDNIKKNLSDLGIGKPVNDKLEAPFDVRYLLTGDSQYRAADNNNEYYHKITANNLHLMNEISALSRTMFLERTSAFLSISNNVIANLDSKITNYSDKIGDLRDELSAFVQIAAYKKWIDINDKKSPTLRNSLIYDTEGNEKTIVDIVQEAIERAPNNDFLKFILPVTTTLKIGKKKQRNVVNKDLINTIEGKTRGRLEPDLIATLMDSFTDLYQNPHTQFHAKALLDYLIVKDGLMFKNKSFIKMIPTLLFKEMSRATDTVMKVMAANSINEYKRVVKDLALQDVTDREGNLKEFFSSDDKAMYNELFKNNNLSGIKDALFTKIFGLNTSNFYHRFENIYATDVRNQRNLEMIKPKIKPQGSAQRMVRGIQFAREENDLYMHVTEFTAQHRSLEGDERKKEFADTINELQSAGFNIVSEEDGDKKKHYIQFKKYVRVRSDVIQQQSQFFEGVVPQRNSKYDLYELVSITRNKDENFSGVSMTDKGEQVPKGIYGVYKKIEAVGTSNSVGVADLGKRPTKEELIKIINNKLKGGDEGNTPNGGTPISPNSPTSGSSATFGGFNIDTSFDPNSDIDSLGFTDISDENIDNALKNLDDC